MFHVKHPNERLCLDYLLDALDALDTLDPA